MFPADSVPTFSWLCVGANAISFENRINVNDPSLISLVNKLQDVFTTVGVRLLILATKMSENNEIDHPFLGAKPYRFATDSCCGIAIQREEFSTGKYRRTRLVR